MVFLESESYSRRKIIATKTPPSGAHFVTYRTFLSNEIKTTDEPIGISRPEQNKMPAQAIGDHLHRQYFAIAGTDCHSISRMHCTTDRLINSYVHAHINMFPHKRKC